MIIKKAADRKESSAGRVIDYIQRALDYVQRANMKENDRPVTFTANCLSDDIELCKLEIQSTQDQNTRAKGDKTYHMVISFSPEDELTTEIHQNIVADVAERLGFGEHQRVCAIHKDTSNEHCHVIINKIHPENFKILTPYYDGFQMNEIAADLERKYNLTVINHSNEKGQKDINHKMHYDGIKSFNKWVVENVKSDVETIIKDGGNWKQVSDELAKYNLHIRKRGRGLVISDKDKPLFIKSSSVSRKFKELGPYSDKIESPSLTDVKKYERVPVSGSSTLWQQYQNSKDASKQTKAKIHKEYKDRSNAIYDAAQTHIAKAKENKSIRGPAKKERYKFIREVRNQELEKLAADKKAELEKHNTGNWLDFLVKQYNEKGNTEALEQLKKSKIFSPKFKNNTTGTAEHVEPFSQIDKTGNTYEEVGKDKIFLMDNTLGTQSDDIAVASRLLDLALEKFQEPIEVTGSSQFIKSISVAAKIKGVELSFPGEPERENKSQERDISL